MDTTNKFSQFSLQIPDSAKPRIVVIGGGFGGLNFVKSLDRDKFQVVLFDKHNYHTFVPLLYQVATSALEAPSISDAHRRIYGKRDDVFFRALKVLGIDPKTKEVETLVGNLSYDFLIIAAGSVPNFFGNTNIENYSFPLKTLPNATALRTKIYQNLEEATLTNIKEERQRLLNFIIVGGGPTGVEVAGALSELRKYVLPKDYKDLDFGKMNIKIVEGGKHLLAAFSKESSANALKALRKMGVDISFDTLVSDYDGKTITYKDGGSETCGMLIWGAGVAGAVIKGLDENATERSKYVVNDYCQVLGYDTIYAIGDIAYFKDKRFDKGLPGVAQTAIQQGSYVAKLISSMHTAILASKPLDDLDVGKFNYFDKGSLATIGRNKAVADLPGKIKLSGFLAWITWAVVHLFYLNGLRNKVLTFFNWIMNYFNYQNKVRLIIHPVLNEDDKGQSEFVAVNESGK